MMKSIKTTVILGCAWLLMAQQAIAGESQTDLPNGVRIPEIDGSGALIAIGLIAGVVALLREKFYK